MQKLWDCLQVVTWICINMLVIKSISKRHNTAWIGLRKIRAKDIPDTAGDTHLIGSQEFSSREVHHPALSPQRQQTHFWICMRKLRTIDTYKLQKVPASLLLRIWMLIILMEREYALATRRSMLTMFIMQTSFRRHCCVELGILLTIVDIWIYQWRHYSIHSVNKIPMDRGIIGDHLINCCITSITIIQVSCWGRFMEFTRPLVINK